MALLHEVGHISPATPNEPCLQAEDVLSDHLSAALAAACSEVRGAYDYTRAEVGLKFFLVS